MLKHLILATAATALVAVPASAKHRHHRYDPRSVWGYAIPMPVYGYGYVPYRYGTHPDRWMRNYRYNSDRDGYWGHRRHSGDWSENDQGEDEDN